MRWHGMKAEIAAHRDRLEWRGGVSAVPVDRAPRGGLLVACGVRTSGRFNFVIWPGFLSFHTFSTEYMYLYSVMFSTGQGSDNVATGLVSNLSVEMLARGVLMKVCGLYKL
jgi:hypothetical protein